MRILILTVAAGLFVAACGGGGNDYIESLVDPMVDELTQDPDAELFDLSENTVRCSAEVTLETIGEDRLKEENVTPDNVVEILDSDVFDDLGPENDPEAGRALFDCFTDEELVGLGGSFGEEFEQAFQCAFDEVGREAFIDAIVTDNFFESIEPQLTACGFPG